MKKLIYPEWLYRAEVQAAKRFKELKQQARPLPKRDVSAWLEDWSLRENVSWAKEQREAVLASWEHGLLVLTGGPGTGKTTIIRAILDLLESSRCHVVLAAPTAAPPSGWRNRPGHAADGASSARISAGRRLRLLLPSMKAIRWTPTRLLSMRLLCWIFS